MILDKIVEATKLRVQNAKRHMPLDRISESIVENKNPFAFERALKGGDISFICEVKKASPSKGIISEDFPYLSIAKDYEKAGASAISVLTEPDFFKGSNEYLTEIKNNVTIPVLRKDFTIDEYQIYEAALIGADAVLLICSILQADRIKAYIRIADALGMSCIVEAHNEEEVQMGIEAGARIIGVNNRNLKTFDVDINNSVNLRQLVPEEIIFVSESGIAKPEHVQKLRENGTDAVLIGETFMKSPDKKEALDRLRGVVFG